MKLDQDQDRSGETGLFHLPHRSGAFPDAGLDPTARIGIAGTVHDLGNFIQLASSAMRIIGRSPEVRSGRLVPILANAQTSLDQAAELVRHSLIDSRPRADTSPISSLVHTLSEVAASMRGALPPGIRLATRVETDLPAVACNPVELRSAILNLLFNARDATVGDGTIRLTAARGTGDAGAFAEIQVGDRGIGMSPGTVERALDPFFTTKDDGLGGIGLPMVDRFVRDSGGQLEIESEFGVGTLVTLRLPFAGPSAPTPHRLREPST